MQRMQIDPAEGQGDPAEVQGEQGQAGRDHEAVQGVRGQPVLRLPARAAAVPDPDRDVLGHPGTAAPARDTAGQVVASARLRHTWSTTATSRRTAQLFENVVLHQNLDFLGMNLQCSAASRGRRRRSTDSSRNPVKPPTSPSSTRTERRFRSTATTGDGEAPCGSKPVDRIPYYIFLLFMVGTTFYQQRQMQQASPPGAACGQQQAILKLMPLMFGIFGFTFPAGLTSVLDHLQPLADRAAVLPAPGRATSGRRRWSGGSPRTAPRARTARSPPSSASWLGCRSEPRIAARSERAVGQEAAPKKRRRQSRSHGGSRRRARARSPGPAPQHGWNPKTGRRPNTDPRKRGGGSDGAGDGEAGS